MIADRDSLVAIFNGDCDVMVTLLRKLKNNFPPQCLCERIQGGATPVPQTFGETA